MVLTWENQKLVDWVEETIEDTFTFYRLPRQHHKHLKSTNMLERLNEEIKRRTHVVRIFPNPEACQRLVRALAVETHETGSKPIVTYDRLLQNLTHSIQTETLGRAASGARSWPIAAWVWGI
jgi:transposase-like protein